MAYHSSHAQAWQHHQVVVREAGIVKYQVSPKPCLWHSLHPSCLLMMHTPVSFVPPAVISLKNLQFPIQPISVKARLCIRPTTDGMLISLFISDLKTLIWGVCVQHQAMKHSDLEGVI